MGHPRQIVSMVSSPISLKSPGALMLIPKCGDGPIDAEWVLIVRGMAGALAPGDVSEVTILSLSRKSAARFLLGNSLCRPLHSADRGRDKLEAAEQTLAENRRYSAQNCTGEVQARRRAGSSA